MDWQISAFGIILILSALVSGAVAVAAWTRAVSSGGKMLSLLMAAVFEWSLAAAFEAATVNIPAKILLAKLQYFGIVSAPVLMFLFALKFSRLDSRLPKRLALVFWVLPVATLALVLSNEWHWLIWTGYHQAPGSSPVILIFEYGLFFWIYAAYAYVLLLATGVLLLRSYFRFKDIRRRQALILLFAVPWPWIGNAAYLAGLAGIPGRDYTPMGFALAGLLLLWGMVRLHLIDIVPVAREKVIESMSESLIVLDDTGRIAEINPAALELLGMIGSAEAHGPLSKIVGKRASQVFTKWPQLARSLHVPAVGRRELVWGENDERRDYDLRLSPLSGHSNSDTGWVAVLYDITGLKKAEAEAVEAKRLAETIQEAGMTLSATLNPDQVSTLILDLIQKVIAFDIGSFFLTEGTALKIAGVRGLPDDQALIGGKLSIGGHRLCNLVMQQQRPMIIAIFENDDVVLPIPRETPVRSFLGVPVVFQEHVMGILGLFSHKAHHFTEKDVRVAELFASHVAIALENSRLYEQMSQLAEIDNLTGLLNRRRFTELAEKEFERARRYSRALAVILFDIDHFKAINDSHGHLVGDQVLRSVASAVTATIRRSDILCRYGGDEFVVLMPEADKDQALLMAERLRHRAAEIIIVTAGGTLSLTVSVGVSSFEADGGRTLEDLINHADKAMYKAKGTGRNRVCC